MSRKEAAILSKGDPQAVNQLRDGKNHRSRRAQPVAQKATLLSQRLLKSKATHLLSEDDRQKTPWNSAHLDAN